MKNSIVIPVLTDAAIVSGPTGAEVIYYGQPLNLVSKFNTLCTFAQIDALQASSGTSTVAVTAQWSVDGVTWTNFTVGLLSATAAGAKLGTNNSTVGEFAPLVRFNVAISNGWSQQATSRLTVVIIARVV